MISAKKSREKRSLGRKVPEKTCHRTPVFYRLIYVGSCRVERWASFDLRGVVGWDQLIKTKTNVQLPTANFPVIPLTENAFSGTFFLPGTILPGTFLWVFFPVDLFSGYFSGDYFFRGFFSGTFYPEIFFRVPICIDVHTYVVPSYIVHWCY